MEQQLIHRDRYEASFRDLNREIKRLEKDNDQKNRERALQVYSGYLGLLDESFPLLLDEGPKDKSFHQFPREPVHLYLLPPLDSLPENKRLVICQYRHQGETFQAGIELLAWETSSEGASIRSHGGIIPIRNLPGSPDVYKLDKRALSIKVDEDDDGEAKIKLQLAGSSYVRVILNLDEIKVEHADWKEPKKNTRRVRGCPPYRTERYSCKRMGDAIGVEPTWPNDTLWDPSTDKTIHTKEHPRIGRITGADAVCGDPKRVYLASDQARIFGIDLAKDDINYSPLLGGSVYDLLAIPHPDAKEGSDGASDYALLSTANNNTVIILEDERNQIIPIYQQITTNRIVRITGCGERHLLAMDQHHNLRPLWINSPREAQLLRKLATESLYKAFDLDKCDSINPVDSKELKPLIRTQLIRLILEKALDDCLYSGSNAWKHLETCVEWLHRPYKEDTESLSNQRASLHISLMKRIAGILRSGSRSPLLQTRKETKFRDIDHLLHLAPPEQLALLWSLFDAPECAPDGLWLTLFRYFDWPFCWLYYTKLDNNRAIKEPLEEHWQNVQTMRARLLPAMHASRPLTIRSSIRFPSQARHIRSLHKKAHPNTFAMLEYQGGLKVIKTLSVNSFGRSQPWEILAELGASQALWKGRPSSLLSGEGLSIAMNEMNSGFVLLCTDCGELFLYRLKGNQLDQIWSKHIDLRIACCRQLKLPKRQGLPAGVLLSGESSTGKPALWWLDPATQRTRQVWQNKEGSGSIRMLEHDPDTDRLWAIEQQRGKLLAWDSPSPILSRPRSELPSPKTWLERDEPLHALGLSKTAKPGSGKTLVCGGHNGLAIALDAQSGRLLWTVGCGNSLRRVTHLPKIPDYSSAAQLSETGGWLLCGDLNHVLTVDEDGRIIALIEGAGPVTALRRISDCDFLMGGRDGRVLLFSSTTPVPYQDTFDLKAAGISNRLREYTLRLSDVRFNEKQLIATLDTSDVVGDETLIAISLLERSKKHLIAHNGFSKAFRHALLEFITRQDPSRLAWFLRGSELCQEVQTLDADGGYLLRLISDIWKKLPEQSPDWALCHTITASLILLEEMALRSPPIEASQRLLREIVRCIYNPKAFDCPREQLRKEERRFVLRIAQAIRARPSIAPESRQSENWAEWCINLNERWGLVDLEQYAEQLQSVLKGKLPWFSLSQELWLEWIMALASPKASPSQASAPRPIHLLAKPRVVPWSGKEFDNLANCWPNNSAWIAWIHELQTALQALRSIQGQQIVKDALKKRQALLTVLGLFIEDAETRFRLETRQPLLALIQKNIRPIWEAEYRKALDNLEKEVAANPEEYIEISYRDRWLMGGRVEISIDIDNRTSQPIRFNSLSWNDNPITLGKVDLPHGVSVSAHSFPLECKSPDKVHGLLKLKFLDDQKVLYREVLVEKSRGISTFWPDPDWRNTLDRLDSLLDDYVAHRKSFLWLDGHYWPEDERNKLLTHINSKFGITIGEDIPRLGLLGDALQRAELPIFCPDIRLGERNPLRLADQVHQVLFRPDQPGLNSIALSIWHLFRTKENWPPVVDRLLSPLFVEKQLLNSTMKRLMGNDNTYSNFLSGIKKLPKEAFGAWCYGDTLYIEELIGGKEAESVKGYYSTAPAVFGRKIWNRLLNGSVPDNELAIWLNLSVDVMVKYRKSIRSIEPLYANIVPGESAVEKAAIAILGSLTSQRPIPFGESWVVNNEITLHHADYSRCYLLPRNISTQGLTHLIKETKGKDNIWLSPEEELSAPLPGKLISITADDAHRLVLTLNSMQAVIALNQIAATQGDIDADQVFRSAGGMTKEQVKRHFAYRDIELKKIKLALKNADEGSWGAILICGERKIGKTTLRQRVEYEVQKDTPGRIILAMNFEGLAVGLKGFELEYWFHSELTKKSVYWAQDSKIGVINTRIKKPTPINLKWNKSKLTNIKELMASRDGIREWFRQVKRQSGGLTPLLTFDETDNLVRCDSHPEKNRDPYELFHFLRQMVQDGLICLVATTYPHGASDKKSLRQLNKDAATPVFHLFTDEFTLEPWTPRQTWDYLHTKLEGLGVVLPSELKQEVLSATHGTPWVVHALGLELCKAHSKGRRLILHDRWEKARFPVMKQVRNEVMHTVQQEAERNDLKYGLTPVMNANCLGGGNLWNALMQISSQGEMLFPVISSKWSKFSFHLNELMAILGPAVEETRLLESLERLTSTIVLLGDRTDPKIFHIAHGMRIVGGAELK